MIIISNEASLNKRIRRITRYGGLIFLKTIADQYKPVYDAIETGNTLFPE